MRPVILKLLILVFSINYFAFSVSAQLIKHSYHFYNNLSASAPDCGPDLFQSQVIANCTALNPSPGSFISTNIPYCGVDRTVYHNNMDWGLGYPNTGGTVTTTYTIHLYVKNTNWGNRPWTRIIDFSSGTSDNGIYYKTTSGSTDRCLDFYPNGIVGPCPYFNDSTYYLLTFTRNAATGIIDVYVNKTLFTSYNDVAKNYVGNTGIPIYIYRDDQAVPCESGEANFAYLAFTNQYSSQANVDSVYNLICTIANPGATSDFSFTPDPGCESENITVTYTGNIVTPGTGYSFNWSWGGGTIVSGSGMGPYVVNWNTAGIKDVTLTVINNACGNQNSNTEQILIGSKTFSTISQTICEGDNFQGYTTSGVYIDTLINSSGCDSIRTLNLTVSPRTYSTISQSICQGESYQGYTSAGNYIDTLINSNGCDSVRTLQLSVKPNSFSTFTQSICEGQSFSGYSATGVYTDTFNAANGCDSIRTINLTVRPRSSSTINHSICEGQSFQGYSTTGVYKDTLMAVNGCDSIRTLNLTVQKKPKPDLGPDKELCREDSLLLTAGLFSSYLWQDGSTLSYFVARQAGIYSVTVSGNCGSVTDQIAIKERPCGIYFPSAFTPNKDGKNDLFKILNAFHLKDYSLTIYNRWGEKIFEARNYSNGWDGSFNGKLQNPGVYIWHCRFKKNNIETFLKGTVLLIR